MHCCRAEQVATGTVKFRGVDCCHRYGTAGDWEGGNIDENVALQIQHAHLMKVALGKRAKLRILQVEWTREMLHVWVLQLLVWVLQLHVWVLQLHVWVLQLRGFCYRCSWAARRANCDIPLALFVANDAGCVNHLSHLPVDLLVVFYSLLGRWFIF